jgi:hypothetical protein
MLEACIGKVHLQPAARELARFLNQRKQDKIQQLQRPNQSNVDNLTNVRREASRHFRNRENNH